MGAPRKEFVATRVLDYIERAKVSPPDEMPLVLDVICAFVSDNPKRPIKKDTLYTHMGGAATLRRILEQAKILQARNALKSEPGDSVSPRVDWEKRYRETLAKLTHIEAWAESVGIPKETLNEIYSKHIPPPDRREPGTGGGGRRWPGV